MMNAPLGTLHGIGEVRAPDGTLLSTFTLEAECSKEQAEQLARELSVPLEDLNNGNHSRS